MVYDTRNLNLWYGDHHGLKDVNLSIYENEVTAIIGPSGCGKSTYLKTLNRMVELVPIVRTSGEILYRERNILDKNYTVEELRTHVEWSSKSQTHSQNRFMIISPMVRGYMA